MMGDTTPVLVPSSRETVEVGQMVEVRCVASKLDVMVELIDSLCAAFPVLLVPTRRKNSSNPSTSLMDDDDDPDPSPHFHAPLSSLLFPTSDASDDDVAVPSSLPPRHARRDPLGHPAAGPCLLAFGLEGSQRDCGDFDAKGVLKCGEDYEEAKLIKPLGHDGAMGGESSLVGMQVEVFYPENTKWYDSPGGLDHSGDSGDDRFRHGGLV